MTQYDHCAGGIGALYNPHVPQILPLSRCSVISFISIDFPFDFASPGMSNDALDGFVAIT